MSNVPSFSRQVIDASARPLLVGRGPGVDVVLFHPSVARKHALLLRTSVMLQISDRSGGATYVNGRQVRGAAVLRDGDTVVFGGEAPFRVENGKLVGTVDGGGIALRVERLTVEVQNSGVTSRLLDNITIKIKPGQFVGLLGPSGAGKTTLLRCLVAYVTPTAGSIHAGDLELPGQAASFWPHVGFVPQNDILYLALTARESLDFALQFRATSLNRREQRQLIDERLIQLGLIDRADVRLENLSGGERKRVSVAIETLARPRALFLDEPTAGLDPANETRVMHELRQLAEGGTTVVCVTHVLENVQQLHRAIVLVKGRVVYDDPPDGLLDAFGAKSYPELYEPKRLNSRTPVVVRQ
jgi:ABC transport system ATP-binding/permease protein